ncbi:MAG: hypothetical protein WDO12_04975 [Pseudomonadota bacterium]
MRELTFNETYAVGGAGALPPLTFTTPITTAVMNDVVQANLVAGAVAGAFMVGYTIGGWLNSRYGWSEKLANLIS